MKTIKTLIPDIQEMLKGKGWFGDDLTSHLAQNVSRSIQEQMNKERTPYLRLSQLGTRCPCALWHSINKPDLIEPMPPWAEVKFSFGHMIEALALTLAKAAGHEVTGEQDELWVDGIRGHRDAVIDGCIVDVKSAASRSFLKFKDGSLAKSDSFGYLDQLDAYMVASAGDPLVRRKDVGYILAIDKQLGHMCLYEHQLREQHIRDRIRDFKAIVASKSAPGCTCSTEPKGKSGNVGLSTISGYNPFKYACFPHLRTFIYSSGPEYLTVVKRLPDVPEINRFGKIINIP